MYKFIRYMINDHEQAKDLMQDTFLRAYEHVDSFQGGNAKSWLLKIARYTTIDFMRKKKPVQYLLDHLASTPSRALTPEQTLALNEEEKELYRAIASLKLPYREVIILRKIKELSIKETAEILGWSESKVKTNVWRAMHQLKTRLRKEGNVGESIQP